LYLSCFSPKNGEAHISTVLDYDSNKIDASESLAGGNIKVTYSNDFGEQ